MVFGSSIDISLPGALSLQTVAALPLSELESGKLSPSAAPAAQGSLPRLPYSLRTRKLAIAIAWTLVLLDACFLPLSLFFALKYGVKLDDARSTSSRLTISSKSLINLFQVWE